MLEIIKNRIFFNIFLLFFLVGFLIFPKIILANNFQDITIKEANEYLELPKDKVEGLIHSLIKIFHSKWEDLMVYGQPTANQMAVPNIMKNVVRAQAMNYLLIDAPIDVAWDMINGGIKIGRIFLVNDISGVLNELEKESVKKAVDYGLNILLQEGIKMTPGAIKFKYTLRNNTETTVVIQYIVIYKPVNEENGELAIKFYSPNSIKPPKNKGSVGSLTGFYTELIKDLPPFTVEVQGLVENYKWIETPSMNINFPEAVPDFGIEPIGFLEQHLIKPTENAIKEIEIIAKKITGKSLGIIETWGELKNASKNFLSELNLFSPASLVEIPQISTYPAEKPIKKPIEEIAEVRPQQAEIVEETVGVRPKQTETVEETVEVRPRQMTLAEMQKTLDNISEEIDDLSKEILVLSSINNEKLEIEKDELVEDRHQQAKKEIVLCDKNGLPSRNKVIFNEVAWMGTENSANDEWIELKNISEEQIDLTGWQILNNNNKINILFATETILQNNYFLLERTDDKSVPNISADLIYTGALKNTNEALYLFDENCRIQSMISDLPQWNYGDNKSKQTMERKLDLTWQTSKDTGGTPKAENSEGYTVVFNCGSPAPTPAPAPAPTDEPVEVDPQQTICTKENATTSSAYFPVVLNEIAWMGSASSSADEWIELKNISTSSVSLENWQLVGKNSKTNENKIKIIFNENDEIASSSFFLLERTNDNSIPGITANKIYTGAMNDSNFTLRLFDNTCTLIDEIAAASSWPAGQTEPKRKTMERDLNLSWQTSYSTSSTNDLFGTPKNENSQAPKIPEKENQIPIALFNYQPQNPLINQEIIFDATSSVDSDGTIISYVWDFGDNTSTTTENSTTTYNYSTSSDYIIALQVIDDKNTTSGLATSSITVSSKETPTLKVVINEIAWMGTSATNSSDEWIELYNNTTSTIDLTDWEILKNGEEFIKFSTSTNKIIELSTSTILAQKFYLLERKHNDEDPDNTIIDIPADLIYTGILNNGGEKLELRDENGVLVDLIDCSSGWFVGTKTAGYVSMERINAYATNTDSSNWADNNIVSRNGKTVDNKSINGTPKEINSVSQTDTQIKSLPFNEFDEIALTYLGNPYIITESLTVPTGKTLTIEPGVTLKFKIPDVYGPNDGVCLTIQGNLNAVGKENEQILFTSTADRWIGMVFEGNESEIEISSYLEYVVIEKAKSWESPSYPAVKIDKKAVSIKNSTLDASYNYRGIYLIDSYSIIDNVILNYFNDSLYPHSGEYTSAIYIEGGAPTIKNSIFQTASYGIYIQTTESCSQNSNFRISSNIFIQNNIPIYIKGTGLPCFEENTVIDPQSDNLNNVFDGIVFAKTIINYDTIWQADIPFMIEKQLSIENATLTVASGMTIKFKYINDGKNRAFLEIKNGASLIAQGTAENKIAFTSAMKTPSSWNWKAIYFREGSYGFLDNVKISYGGSGNTLNDCLKIETENILLTNVEKYKCSID